MKWYIPFFFPLLAYILALHANDLGQTLKTSSRLGELEQQMNALAARAYDHYCDRSSPALSPDELIQPLFIEMQLSSWKEGIKEILQEDGSTLLPVEEEAIDALSSRLVHWSHRASEETWATDQKLLVHQRMLITQALHGAVRSSLHRKVLEVLDRLLDAIATRTTCPAGSTSSTGEV